MVKIFSICHSIVHCFTGTKEELKVFDSFTLAGWICDPKNGGRPRSTYHRLVWKQMLLFNAKKFADKPKIEEAKILNQC